MRLHARGAAHRDDLLDRWSAAVVSMLPVLVLMLYLRGWFRARRSELRKLLHM